MIRSTYPVPALTRIRLRLELATRRTRRALEERRRALRTAAEEQQAHQSAYLSQRWQQDLERQRRTCAEFYNNYDALVALLCLAAHEGITPGLEEKYRYRREWFCGHYPSIKSLISGHVKQDDSDGIPGFFGRRSCDGFEALFFPTSLEIMFANDGGNLIGRLIRTQAALTAWEEALARNESACRVPAPLNQ